MTKLALPPRNAILHGDCIDVLGGLASDSFDFALTDPPYIVRYESRDGRRVHNDENSAWLHPAFAQIHRVLKPGSFCVSFYGWNRVDRFVAAWNAAGFRIVGHIVFRKQYASGGKLLRYTHECAYLLAKGDVTPPSQPIADVIDWKYTGNRLHPTQKPVSSMRPLIEAFCPAGGLVLDPFCGSGATLVAAHKLDRGYVGIEIDPQHHATAERRLAALNLPVAA
ncbi:MAG: DNA methyltransferase [Acidobacteriaceae bacterium]|jgi:site-specific DNA-methyltransferase (adenine-specific)